MARAVSRRMQIAQQRGRPKQMGAKTLAAPVGGWVTVDSLIASRPNSALLLDNIFPEQQSVRLRGGSRVWFAVSAAVVSMMVYQVTGASKFFVATATELYDATSPNDVFIYDQNFDQIEDENGDPILSGDEASPILDDLGAGYFSYVNFSTSGGYFLTAVNGVDEARLFDGEEWYDQNGGRLVRLEYDSVGSGFTVGLTVTGATSGATGVVERIIDNVLFGTLYLRGGSGDFQNNETITDSGSGAALANGASVVLAPAITGGDTSTFSHVSAYRERLFFVKKDSLTVYYLPVNSIGGALSSFNLAGVFSKGGEILFTAPWSTNTGSGLDNALAVVSTEGEIAVYTGTNPSSAETWALLGVYEIARPLGKRALMRAGGDVLIATQEGLVALSSVLEKDAAALSLTAVSANIEPNWREEALNRLFLPWEIAKWTRKNMAIISLPTASVDVTTHYCFVVNLKTGAWARYTGWDTRCLEVFNDWAYFGTGSGRVMQAEVGGDDAGDIYYPTVVWNWNPLDALGVYKTILQARATYVTSTELDPQISCSTDYAVTLPSPPNAPAVTVANSLWDVGKWDQALWDEGGSKQRFSTDWVSIGQSGYSHAPQIQHACSGNVQTTGELVEITVTYELGDLVV